MAQEQATQHVFVVFRGTSSLEDWLSNLTFPQQPHPWGAVELGFSLIYGQCSAAIVGAVQTAAAPNVYVSGHSLGAALATLATADLVNSGIAPHATMYSYAGPRVGDPSFAGRFDAHVPVAWRIVNTEDLVTTVPLPSPVLRSRTLAFDPLKMLLMLANGAPSSTSAAR